MAQPIDDLFVGEVQALLLRPDALEGFALLEAERAQLSEHAVASRQLTYALGRAAAARGLAALGLPRQPLLQGEIGEPLWPAGVVGSISHTADAAAAVVASVERSAGVGVDLELVSRRPTLAIERRVCREPEREWVMAAGDDDARAARLLRLVMAKEATFKAFYPMERVFLNFADAELLPSEEGFAGRLLRQASPQHPVGTRYHVRLAQRGDLLIAALALPPLDS